MIVDVVGIPKLWAVVMMLIHCRVETLLGHIIFRISSTKISAAVPGIESNPAFFNSFKVSSIEFSYNFDM
ncbi:hypothetical protein ES703_06933 [subsurface metagenome]